MKLKLTRPLVFFDLETTGTNISTDRIVEISLVKLMPDGTILEKTRRLNPEMHIPEAATEIHGITDEDVAQMPTFRQVGNSLAQLLAGCDIAGYNSNRFDIPLLDQEFERAKIDFDLSKARMIDVQTIYHKKEPRTLVAAYRYYCGKELEGAHGALADTKATMEVLLAQLERYDDVPCEVGALAEYASPNRNVDIMGRLIFDEKGREIINFGKYKGQVAEEILAKEPGYYSWIMQGDFPRNTKNAFTRIMLRSKSKK